MTFLRASNHIMDKHEIDASLFLSYCSCHHPILAGQPHSYLISRVLVLGSLLASAPARTSLYWTQSMLSRVSCTPRYAQPLIFAFCLPDTPANSTLAGSCIVERSGIFRARHKTLECSRTRDIIPDILEHSSGSNPSSHLVMLSRSHWIPRCP